VLNELWGRFDDEGIKGVRELDDGSESCEHSIKKWAKTEDNFGRPGESQQLLGGRGWIGKLILVGLYGIENLIFLN